MTLGLALGAAITGLGVLSTVESVSHVGRAAWIGFALAFVAGLFAAGLMRYGDLERADAGGRPLPTAFRVLAPGVGVGIGFALVLAVGGGVRLVVLGACGGLLMGAAALYAVFPARQG